MVPPTGSRNAREETFHEAVCPFHARGVRVHPAGSRHQHTCVRPGRRRNHVTVGNSDGHLGRHHSGRQRHGQEQRGQHGIHGCYERERRVHGAVDRSGRLHRDCRADGIQDRRPQRRASQRGDPSHDQGRSRSRRARRDRRRPGRQRDHSDAVGRRDRDDRYQPDSEAADRKPQRAGVRDVPARRQHSRGQPRFHNQWIAAELDQHHH